MKQIKNILFSMELMLILTLIFAIASAMGTFIENDHGTETAWAVIYTTRWFEIVQVLLAINLIGNIFKFNLFRKEKLPVLLFHSGFIVVLIGAAVTRYMGYEGIMHIREGETTNLIRSSENYIQLEAETNGQKFTADQNILLSKISDNDFTLKLPVDGKEAVLKFRSFIPNAQRVITEDPNGIAMVEAMLVDDESQKPQTILLKNGESFAGQDLLITLGREENNSTKSHFSIYMKDDKFYFKSDLNVTWFRMSDSASGVYEAGMEHLFEKGRLYDLAHVKLVPKNIFTHAKESLQSATSEGGRTMQGANPSVIVADLSYDGKTEAVTLYGFGKGSVGKKSLVSLGGVDFTAQWGAKLLPLPFSLKLNDFQLERYPGSESPSSYASEVTLIDEKEGLNMPFRIYMNHVLDHKNHRFFQSSYDPDEGGTVLSVNNDPGKIPTYIGYFLLSLGLILNILNPNSRFRKLALAVQKETIAKSIALFALIALGNHAPLYASQVSSIAIAQSYDKVHAAKFGDLLIQTTDGRITPVDTFSNEVLLKLSKKSSMLGLDSNQILLGMITAPNYWQEIGIIKVQHDKIKKILGLPEGEDMAKFSDFFDYNQSVPYKLASYIEESSLKRPIERNQFDREIIKTDERLNILYMVFTGDLMKLVPKPNDPALKWYSVKDSITAFDEKDSQMIRTMFLNYFNEVNAASENKNWQKADVALGFINTYQRNVAGNMIPSQTKLDAEKFFKKSHFSINSSSLISLLASFF